MYLEILKQGETFCLRFWKLKDNRKGTTTTFSSYKLTRKLCLVYLDLKLQEDRCG